MIQVGPPDAQQGGNGHPAHDLFNKRRDLMEA